MALIQAVMVVLIGAFHFHSSAASSVKLRKVPTFPTRAEPTYPTEFGVVLFPAFQALDVFGPLDALNLLSLSHRMNVHLIAETMEPVSTKPISPNMNKFNSSFFESIVPTHIFDSPPPNLDVLLVPGGLGTRANTQTLNKTISFVKTSYPKLQHSFLTICTGSGVAARAGVLDGRRATTNKRAWNDTTALGPNVNWISHARWVNDGNVWTSSGVSAGMDMILGWIENVFDSKTASDLALGMEYDWHRNSSWDPFATYYGLK